MKTELSREESYQVKTLVFHDDVHLDELVCWVIFAISDQGETLFPGAGRNVHTETYNPIIHDDGRSELDWLTADHTLFIGCRGGTFDEHGKAELYEQDISATTLVLEYFGLLDNPAWTYLDRQITREDRQGANEELHLARQIKNVYDYLPQENRDLAMMLGIVELFVQGTLAKQEIYYQAQELARKSYQNEVVNPNAREPLKLIAAKSCDNPRFNQAARTENCDGLGAALVLRMQTTGLVQIWPHQKVGLRDLRLLFDAILAEEERICGEPKPDLWYYHEDGSSIYNGTRTHPHVEPTRIPFDTLVRLCTDFLREAPIIIEKKQGRCQNPRTIVGQLVSILEVEEAALRERRTRFSRNPQDILRDLWQAADGYQNFEWKPDEKTRARIALGEASRIFQTEVAFKDASTRFSQEPIALVRRIAWAIRKSLPFHIDKQLNNGCNSRRKSNRRHPTKKN